MASRPGRPVRLIVGAPGRPTDTSSRIRQAQEWTGDIGHLLSLWSAAVKQALYPQIDEQITARLTESEAWRYEREHSREVLQQQQLRAAQHAGHDLGAVIEQITAAPMGRARSISSVLHGRLQRLDLPDLGHDVTACVARCPDAFRAWSRAGQPLG